MGGGEGGFGGFGGSGGLCGGAGGLEGGGGVDGGVDGGGFDGGGVDGGLSGGGFGGGDGSEQNAVLHTINKIDSLYIYLIYIFYRSLHSSTVIALKVFVNSSYTNMCGTVLKLKTSFAIVFCI